MRKDPLKWLFNTTTSGVIWHKRNIFFYWCSHFMMDTTKKYMYMHSDHWRLSIIHSSMNKWMNEWEIKKKDGTEGWNRRTVVTFRWYLGFVYLFLTTFLVRTRGLSRYLTYLDFSFFDRHNPALTLIFYISRKIKRLVVGALKKKQNKFYVISSPNSLQS